jgi:hypothetical protein
MNRSESPVGGEIVGLKVSQWLAPWEKVQYSPKFRRRKPEPYFFLFTLRASWLIAHDVLRARQRFALGLSSSLIGSQQVSAP